MTHVAVLERHEDEAVLALDQETAIAKAMNLNRYEFNYLKAPALVAYEYFNPQISLGGGSNRRAQHLGEGGGGREGTLRSPNA